MIGFAEMLRMGPDTLEMSTKEFVEMMMMEFVEMMVEFVEMSA